MRARQVRHYEDRYNAAGILEHDAPPPALLALAADADVIATSDLERAVASAARVAPGRPTAVTPLLRELYLEPPRWLPLPLPIEGWDVLSHLQWTYRLLRGSDHEYVRRAGDAADWLIERAGTTAAVLAVTHGGIRRLLAARLAARGWRAAPGPRRYNNWSAWSYTR